MNIKTRDFGYIAVNEEDEITFTCGMYGFEEYKKYVILKDSPEDDVMYLQSLENSDLSFVLIDPYAVATGFDPSVNEEDLNDLETAGESELKFLVIAIIKEEIKDSVVNLKSPIALNPKTRKAKQVILQNSYPLRYSILQEGDSIC
ncbi:flagellar assembly protein FliW [Sedimentibacter saalensis]|uniref:Flagellar assembly factor FliW n=1 Tax=Sedimentibacter saalensis TaxID=130788 RepID=A0A562J6K2_9FIRM|nr:flagellar assembly protein FliW [Sedimentibacter saalensis]TWH78750.1 flagellar assembly factor FliW [Sedimentibacter saalensis]